MRKTTRSGLRSPELARLGAPFGSAKGKVGLPSPTANEVGSGITEEVRDVRNCCETVALP